MGQFVGPFVGSRQGEETSSSSENEQRSARSRSIKKKFDRKKRLGNKGGAQAQVTAADYIDSFSGDVTRSTPQKNGGDTCLTAESSPSTHSDERSMSSSSIIETNNQDLSQSHKVNQNVAGLASKIIPKRAWSGYHLLHLRNKTKSDPITSSTRLIRSSKIRPNSNNNYDSNKSINSQEMKNNYTSNNQQNKEEELLNNEMDKLQAAKAKKEEDMEQLISLMQKHNVSDDIATKKSFDFNFSSSSANTIDRSLLTPQLSPITTATNTNGFTPSPEFKFSFSANIPPPSTTTTTTSTSTTTTTAVNYIEVGSRVEEEEEVGGGRGEGIDAATNTSDGNQVRTQAATNIAISEERQAILNNRKILPLPKPRVIKSSISTINTSSDSPSTKSVPLPPPIINTNLVFNTTNTDNSYTSSDRDKKKKMKWSTFGNGNGDDNSSIKSAISDNGSLNSSNCSNKRKERNWKDTFVNNSQQEDNSKEQMGTFLSPLPPQLSQPIVPRSILPPGVLLSSSKNIAAAASAANKNGSNTTTSGKKNVNTSSSNAKKNTSAIPPSLLTASISITEKRIIVSSSSNKTDQHQKKKQPTTANTSTTTTAAKNKKKNSNNKKKNASNLFAGGGIGLDGEEIAPGGFLSSDITLFENPISPDDWICLFCQYDILFSGYEEAKKKNGFYRRKRERTKKLKEAELRRIGVLSDCDAHDHDHSSHSHHNDHQHSHSHSHD